MNTARTPLFYMANLGSEFTRVISAYERGDSDSLDTSIVRARAIIHKLEESPELEGRTGEIEILDRILQEKRLELDTENLKNYFLPFAMRLMHHAHHA